MTGRETVVIDYFNAWVKADGSRLNEFFAPDARYSECYGPEYHGIDQIERWFADWNRRGRVLEWRVKQFLHDGPMTAVEWYFSCEYDGNVDGFDGVSLIRFDDSGRIVSLKEFQSKAEHVIPYG